MIVVDVGNTRIKWGRCAEGHVVQSVSLPPDDAAAWQQQLERWPEARAARWVVSGVHPQRRDTLVRWLGNVGVAVRVLDSYRQLPLVVRVDAPETVGIDRLLDAVAVNLRRPPDAAAVIVDAGTAVTVDLVDVAGVFRGGAIFPGLALMARALHGYTALLPEVEITTPTLPPGRNTVEAIRVGIYWAVCGGIQELIARYHDQYGRCCVFVTGGDADRFGAIPGLETIWPEMTLAGILHASSD